MRLGFPIVLLVALVVVLLVPPPSWTQPDLTGTWKHVGKPAWIAFDFDAGFGVATIARHDENPDAVGLVLIRDIVATPDRPGWTGTMYAGDEDAFVPVVLTLEDDGTLVVATPEGVDGPVDVLRLHRKDPR